MSTSDHAYSTAAGLIAAMDAGTVSAVELTEAAIERIERQDGDINPVLAGYPAPPRDLCAFGK
ncbi:hypothetical protein E1286_13460 [Nonomuraea terrae]|uniref:Amidase n=1 Tax=Nonomuraea terrae TaxID=2530383 RepID=A0A4R4YZ14_9ACTN|nr:hypothetical protein [Nonomuraea terrae]TDD49719.1 hypothetical protein E1286_13460 [Nonomuraea terrae]